MCLNFELEKSFENLNLESNIQQLLKKFIFFLTNSVLKFYTKEIKLKMLHQNSTVCLVCLDVFMNKVFVMFSSFLESLSCAFVVYWEMVMEYFFNNFQQKYLKTSDYPDWKAMFTSTQTSTSTSIRPEIRFDVDYLKSINGLLKVGLLVNKMNLCIPMPFDPIYLRFSVSSMWSAWRWLRTGSAQPGFSTRQSVSVGGIPWSCWLCSPSTFLRSSTRCLGCQSRLE